MTQKEIDDRIDKLMSRFDEVNSYFIQKVAQQVMRIGELNASSVNVITIMASMVFDIADINRRIAQAAMLSVGDVHQLYKDIIESEEASPRFERALKETPLTPNDKGRVMQYVESVSRQTAGTMYNLSNTTLVSETYRHTVDNAILAVSSGMGDYSSAVRQSIKELGYNGLQMQYPSGYHRRLDTAVRQNVIDGANQIAQHGSEIIGEKLKYDAVELSAHARSAPDHEPVQGRVFLKEEFAKMQAGEDFVDIDGNHYAGFRRPIGEWNCMHIQRPFSTQYSKRQFSDEQLKQWAEDNAKGCEIDGKHYTTYEAAQLMRKMETQVRRLKDTANAARAAGDDVLRQQCQEQINVLVRKYDAVAKTAGMRPRRERMRVEGFRMVKVQPQPQKQAAS